jgi:hypothetical protein
MTGNVRARGQKSTFSLLFGDLMSVGTSCSGSEVSSCAHVTNAYQHGNSIDVGAGGVLDVRPTTLIDISAVNRSLASFPGQKGGARRSPNEKSVAKSNIGKSNSENSPDDTAPPDENAVRATDLKDIDALIQLDQVTIEEFREQFTQIP